MLTAVDLLVFGPHPDDIEIGFGGGVALHVARGYRVGLCDLTLGELGSNGTVDERLAEAEAARAVLGADWRINLEWPDGGPYDTPAHVLDVVRLVRAVRPRVVAVPHWSDRHPDHRASSEVLSTAIFKSGLRRFTVPTGGEVPVGTTGVSRRGQTRKKQDLTPAAWRPQRVCYYFINDTAPVSFALDVSSVYEKKRQALDCHQTQFAPAAPESVATRLTASSFRQMIESRDAHLGALTGVAFAEGIVLRETMVRATLFEDLSEYPA